MALDLLAKLTLRERRILSIIRTEGSVTRASLIQRSGLSGPAVFRVTEDLAAKNFLLIGERIADGRGQPSNVVRLNTEAVFTLGISVMNDYAEAAIMDLVGSIVAVENLTVEGMLRDDIISNAKNFLDRMMEGGLSRSAFVGVGVALAAYFVGDGFKLNPAAALDDWAMIDLADICEATFNVPVKIENIANAAAIGELMLGVGKRYSSFAYLNFAAGFGGGVVIDGKPWRGAHGNAGEFATVLNSANLYVPTLEDLRLRLVAAGVSNVNSVSDLVALFDPAWPSLDQWVTQSATSVSVLAKLIGATIDVDALVLGGRLPPLLAQRIAAEAALSQDELNRAARRGIDKPTLSIVPASISALASVIGAAALPMPFVRSGS